MNTDTRTTCYTERAQATKARRRAKGMYQRPSAAQKAAYTAYIRGGLAALTKAQCALMSTNPWLAPSQRAEFAQIAAQ